jgi:hypothetical protein
MLADSIFRILVAKGQSNGETQNTDGRHHSEDGWNAEVVF